MMCLTSVKMQARYCLKQIETKCAMVFMIEGFFHLIADKVNNGFCCTKVKALNGNPKKLMRF